MIDIAALIQGASFLWTPLTVAVLVGVASLLTLMAFAPAEATRAIRSRLENYLPEPADTLEEIDMGRSFGARALAPVLRSVLRALGRLVPRRNIEHTQDLLMQAGQPMGLTALDFYGLRLMMVAVLGGMYFFLLGRALPLPTALRNALGAGLVGFLLPAIWVRSRARGRQRRILRALPDALDMLTIGVEAGLAFESALMRVSQRWDNDLTRELRRTVAEMRVGTPRDVALQRLAQRAKVPDLVTFVAVLVQSTQLGVSIAQVLHTQAAQMRVRRRQRAEELARQAGLKMVFALLLFVFPAMLVVILGPSVPAFGAFFESLGGGGIGIR
jgi:tight adherence protein C